jgi:hypothetical protein
MEDKVYNITLKDLKNLSTDELLALLRRVTEIESKVRREVLKRVQG